MSAACGWYVRHRPDHVPLGEGAGAVGPFSTRQVKLWRQVGTLPPHGLLRQEGGREQPVGAPLRECVLASDPRVTFLVHLPHVERLPTILSAYRCHHDRVALVLLTSPSELMECERACSSTLSCACITRRHPVTLQHRNIIPFLKGKTDLLYFHADMWIDGGRMLREISANRHAAFMPAAGLQNPASGGAILKNGCVPLEQLGDHSAWVWPNRSKLTCRAAVASAGLMGRRLPAQCCYGFSDLLFLPARLQHPFAQVASDFEDVVHEVAIPTVIHALSSWDVHVSRSINCLGGCCVGVTWNDTKNALCGA